MNSATDQQQLAMSQAPIHPSTSYSDDRQPVNSNVNRGNSMSGTQQQARQSRVEFGAGKLRARKHESECAYQPNRQPNVLPSGAQQAARK